MACTCHWRLSIYSLEQVGPNSRWANIRRTEGNKVCPEMCTKGGPDKTDLTICKAFLPNILIGYVARFCSVQPTRQILGGQTNLAPAASVEAHLMHLPRVRTSCAIQSMLGLTASTTVRQTVAIFMAKVGALCSCFPQEG